MGVLIASTSWVRAPQRAGRSATALVALVLLAAWGPARADEPAQRPKPFLYLEGHQSLVTDMAFSPDGKTLASAAGNRLDIPVPAELALWDVATGRLRATLPGHVGTVFRVAFSADGTTLASAGMYDRTARLWDVETGRALHVLKHPHLVFGVAFSPDGKTLATACADRRVRLWDVPTGRLRATCEGHEREVQAVGFSPDGRYLASAGPETRGASIRLWDPATGRCRKILYSRQDIIATLAFTPDGRTLVTSHERGEVQAWDIATGRVRTTFQHEGANSVVRISPDGKLLATGELIDLRGRRPEQSVPGPDGREPAAKARREPTGRPRRRYVGKDNLWDMATGRRLASFHEPDSSILAFSPDGKTLAVSRHKVIEFWDVGELLGRGIGAKLE